jgi:hypothetical protein
MRIVTWNVRSQYSSGSLTVVPSRELMRCTLDLAGIQEDRWDKGGMERAGVYIFLWKKKKIISRK